MIPNAIVSTGPYADLWSHLKSIDHALGRISTIEQFKDLTDLDKDRLSVLKEFLSSALAPDSDGTHFSPQLLESALSHQPNYSSAINLRHRLMEISEFVEWDKVSKNESQIDKKIIKLIDFIDSYLNDISSSLFSKLSSSDEIKVLRSIINAILSDVEIELER